MRRAPLSDWILALFAALLVGVSVSAQPSASAVPSVVLDGAAPFVYKQTGLDELRLYVFNPAESGAQVGRPAIIFFFGGTWTGGSVEQFAAQARYLRGRGMVAIVADYRVRDRNRTTPFESMADARSAIRWVRTHANDLNVDPGRIAAAGGVAGAHAALSAALFTVFDEPDEDLRISARPDALVLFDPVVDTSTFEEFGARWKDASPAHHLEASLPPTVIFHGRQNETVPYAAVEQFCDAAVSQGSRCELHVYDGASGGFFDRRVQGGRWYLETLLEADRFLTSLGYLRAPVSATLPN